MNAEERNIGKVLTEQICFEIPPYQRPYSWLKENVQELLDDTWSAFIANDPEYFVGSLITIECERDRRYEVVDGQQRLTTLNLLFARLRDHITDNAAKEEVGKRILPRNVLTGDAETPRLVLRAKDRSFFQKHVLEGAPVPEKSKLDLDAPKLRITENLQVIDGFLTGKDQKQLMLFANYILRNIYVVFVRTSSLKSAYRLFNVLNARGLPLSNADLIKNALFGLLNGASSQADDLEGRWVELEERLGIERMDSFLGHHRTSLVASKARGSLHEEFEPLIKVAAGPFVLIDTLNESAQNYIRIFDADFEDPAILRPLRSLQRVEYDEWIPPLLAFLNNPVPDLPESEFISLLEKITIQNWVCRMGRTARLTVYYQLINAIRERKSPEEIRKIFRDNARNVEFHSLLDGMVYLHPFASAVLLRLEEASQDDSVTKTFSGLITIEHVLPQAFKDDYWKARFTEEEHRTWLHRLGNLALLSGRKNYRAQYYGFDRKKAIYEKRSEKVSFDLTKDICAESEWTPQVLKGRHEQLMDLARQTWDIS
jgi:hypothetical protein